MEKRQYERPTVSVVGSLQELTQAAIPPGLHNGKHYQPGQDQYNQSPHYRGS